MRVIDCECGTTLKAASDQELERAVRDHVATDHPDLELTDDEVRQMVASRAYDATDA